MAGGSTPRRLWEAHKEITRGPKHNLHNTRVFPSGGLAPLLMSRWNSYTELTVRWGVDPLKPFMVDAENKPRNFQQIKNLVLARRKQEDLELARLEKAENETLKAQLVESKRKHEKEVAELKAGAEQAKHEAKKQKLASDEAIFSWIVTDGCFPLWVGI